MLFSLSSVVLLCSSVIYGEKILGRSHFSPLNENDDEVYYVSTNLKLPFVQAMRFCNNLNLTLVTINSAEENKALWKILRDKSDDFWSSGSRLIDGTTWLWLSNGKPVNFTNWVNGEPSSTNNHCISLEVDSQNNIVWKDKNCYNKKQFVCESTEDEDANKNQQLVWSNVFQSSRTRIPDDVAFGNKQFYFAKQYKGSFWQSQQFCEIIGMKAVSVLTEAENQIIYKHLRDTNAESTWWSSGTKSYDGINWFWLSNGLLVNYARWASGEPSNKDDQCLSLKLVTEEGVFMDDLSCSSTAPVICERSVNDKQIRSIRSVDPPVSVEQPKDEECEQPVINIYINNNIPVDGNQEFLPIRIDDQSSGSEHAVKVDNKWNTCK